MLLNKDFIPILIILFVIGGAAIGGGVYYYSQEPVAKDDTIEQNQVDTDTLEIQEGDSSDESSSIKDEKIVNEVKKNEFVSSPPSLADKKKSPVVATESNTPSCNEDIWKCGNWSDCTQEGSQARACALDFDCGVVSTPIPTIKQNCTPPKPVYSPDPGPQNTVVILVNFPENKTEPFDVNVANEAIFASKNSLKSYLKEVSYGKLILNGHAHGWYTMPRNNSEYYYFTEKWNTPDNPNQPGYIEGAMKASQHEIDFSKYQYVIVIFHGGGTNSAHSKVWTSDDGLISMRVTGFTSNLISNFNLGSSNLAIMAHEFGHSLGAAHAGGWQCGNNIVGESFDDVENSGCTATAYGDFLDAMGTGTNHYSAVRKEEMGFLEPNQTVIVESSGEFLLDQLELPSNGVKQLKIPLGTGRDWGGTHYYTIEYRNPTGYDLNVVDGVYLRAKLAANITGGANTLRPLEPKPLVINPGSPFTDQYRNIKVEVTEKLNNQARVKITK